MNEIVAVTTLITVRDQPIVFARELKSLSAIAMSVCSQQGNFNAMRMCSRMRKDEMCGNITLHYVLGCVYEGKPTPSQRLRLLTRLPRSLASLFFYVNRETSHFR